MCKSLHGASTPSETAGLPCAWALSCGDPLQPSLTRAHGLTSREQPWQTVVDSGGRSPPQHQSPLSGGCSQVPGNTEHELAPVSFTCSVHGHGQPDPLIRALPRTLVSWAQGPWTPLWGLCSRLSWGAVSCDGQGEEDRGAGQRAADRGRRTRTTLTARAGEAGGGALGEVSLAPPSPLQLLCARSQENKRTAPGGGRSPLCGRLTQEAHPAQPRPPGQDQFQVSSKPIPLPMGQRATVQTSTFLIHQVQHLIQTSTLTKQ